MATTKKTTEIAQATICKVTIKATGKIFYQVKSDSSNEYYQLHMNADGEYKCSCPARKPCKHERALNEILDIQVAALFSAEDEAVPAEVQKQVAEPAPVAVVAAPILSMTGIEVTSSVAMVPAPALVVSAINIQKSPIIQAPKFVSKPAPQAVPLAQRGALNGNRGFSLLRT